MVELRAELVKLRGEGEEPTQPDVDEGMGDARPDVDIKKVKKVEAALLAVVAAYGEESKQAKEMSADLESMRETRRQARPLSLQLKWAEKRARGERKTVDAAKAIAAEARKTTRLAEIAVREATDKIAACEHSLHEAEEEEEQRLLRTVPADPAPAVVSVVPVNPTAPICVDALSEAIGDDPEASAALQIIREKIAARVQGASKDDTQFLSAQVQVPFGPTSVDKSGWSVRESPFGRSSVECRF